MKFSLIICYLLLFINFSAHGNQFGYESHEKFVSEVSHSYEKTYHDVLRQFDEHISTNPDDVLALTEKCRFIDKYEYDESDLLYFESVSDDLAQCKTEVAKHSESHPERILYELTSLWGDEALERYDQVYSSGIDQWTNEQKVRFFGWMENTQSWSDSYDLVIPHTGYMKTNDPQFALAAAIYEAESGDKSKALELLEFQQAKTVDDRIKLARLYLDLGLQDKASNTLVDIGKEPGVDEVEIIKLKSLLDDNYSPAVDQITKIKEAWQGEVNLQNLFEHAIEINNYHLAKKIYQTWNSDDFWQDPFKHHKIKLYKASGQWSWGIQDAYAVLMWMAVVIICFLLVFLMVGPVHYRGLYRRVHGKKTLDSLTGWNLKHALFLGTAFFLAGTVLTILYQYESFYSMFFMDEEIPFSAESGLNSKMYLMNAVIMIVTSLLIFKHGTSLFKISISNFIRSLMIAVAVFILFKFLLVAVLFFTKLLTLSATLDLVHLTISDINTNYGTLAAFLTIAFLTPLIEEYLFRGVLLNSFTKHISFAWANIIQAGVFSYIHDNPDHYIHHFIFGLIVGYFVKTQKHLYGAIMFHMINNALAVSVLVL